MNIDYSEHQPASIYHLMTQTIIPRPIAWVLTEHPDAGVNLAPFSYFTPISSSPPLVLFSVGQKHPGEDKDTVTNLKLGSSMVIHIAQASQAEAVTKTAATLALNESEIAHAELSLVPFEGTQLQRVEGAPVAMACELFELKTVGNAPQTLVIAEIKHVYVDDNLISHDAKGRLTIHAEGIDPLARLGAASYSSITSPFSIQRPK